MDAMSAATVSVTPRGCADGHFSPAPQLTGATAPGRAQFFRDDLGKHGLFSGLPPPFNYAVFLRLKRYDLLLLQRASAINNACLPGSTDSTH